MHMHAYACTCMHVHEYACMHMHAYACICTYMHACWGGGSWGGPESQRPRIIYIYILSQRKTPDRLLMIPARDPKYKVCLIWSDDNLHKITTLEHPWGVIGGPWECHERSFGALGRLGNSLGLLEGSLGHCQSQQQKLHKMQMLDDPTMILKPTEYHHFHKIINVDRKSVIGKVMKD